MRFRSRARLSVRLARVDIVETDTSWLAPEDLELVRGRVPMVYVDAVPVRVDGAGQVSHVGLLLRAMADGTISRAVVSGRILYGETVRQALLRHIAKDLGPVCRPQLPPQPAPFTVVEYFPDPTVSGFHDPRQHAVSLAFLVPIGGVRAIAVGPRRRLGHAAGGGQHRGPGRDDRRPRPPGAPRARFRRRPPVTLPATT
jgi:ADP-ribose pyrophosphatase YjhB (NUDIX family)